MPVYYTVFIMLWMVVTAVVNCHASVPTIGEIRHLDHSKGLSSHRVYSIIEDDDQVIWIGTKNGISRFNGNNIRNYNLQGDFYLGDMAARKIQLYKDANGELWAYDNTGRLYLYSKIYDRFIQKVKLGDYLSDDVLLNRFIITSDGKMAFGLSKGLFIIEKGGEFSKIIEDVYVNDVYSLKGRYFIGTTSGLIAIDEKKPDVIRKIVDDISIESIYYDESADRLYLGSFNDGLWKVDFPFNDTSRSEQVAELTDPIRSIARLDDENLAIGIDGSGVYLYNLNSKTHGVFVDSDDSKPFNINGNGIYALSLNNVGDLWVGSYTGGASWIKLSPSPVNRILHEKYNNNSLTTNNVNGISQSPDGSIWYATNSGVDISSPGGTWKHTLRKIVCVSLCPAGENCVAVGTYGAGVYIIDKNGQVKRHLRKDTSGLTSNNIFSIVRDKEGDFWVGSINGDLMLFDTGWNLKKTFPVCPVLSLTNVEGNVVAASTVNGFYIIDKVGEIIQYATAQEQHDIDISVYITPMLFNGDGTVWLGTEGGGLNLYSLDERKMIKGYQKADGLPSNDIHSLIRDYNGDIWIGTGMGVGVLRDSVILSLHYIYGTEHEYNKSAGLLLSDGDVILGSTSGAVRFSPDGIAAVNSFSPLRIVNFIIDGVAPDESDKIAPEIYDELQNGTVTLDYDKNSFTVVFESIDLRYPDDISYKYCLENFDSDWIESSDGSISYKNISPGKYKLKLNSFRISDKRTVDEREIIIVVTPPWYKTWWAWLFYIAIICLVIFFVIRYYLDSVKKKYYEDKIRFFINTAHDIRTPVTLAMAPLEDATKDENLSSNTSYLVNTAFQNIKKLKTITSQLLDFEKIDNNQNSIKRESIDLCEVLKVEASYFYSACNRKDIDLALDLPEEPVCVYADLSLIEKIFDNLMSNACKYTTNGGEIRLKLEASKSKVIVYVSDSGIGIPDKERKHIFSDVYRAKNARATQEIGTGFGLLQVKRIVSMLGGKISFISSEENGTTFTLIFKRIYTTPIAIERQNPISNSMDEIFSNNEVGVDIGEGSPGNYTLLIVEDNRDMRRYMGSIFSREYNVVLCENVNEALEYISTNYPDLIITDVMMPGIQGDDFCNYIKENPETAGIPVILLTAKVGDDAMISGLAKGADDYISKPFNTEILKLKVRGIIENRNRLRDFLMQSAIGKVSETDLIDGRQIQICQSSESGNNLAENDKAFMEKVTNIIIDNIKSTSFTIDSLCREMAMSRTLFYSRLKSLTGKAPQEFIRILRLEKSADLLRKGMAVTNVAEECGFVNVKYFSTLFKKHFGVQPSKYTAD